MRSDLQDRLRQEKGIARDEVVKWRHAVATMSLRLDSFIELVYPFPASAMCHCLNRRFCEDKQKAIRRT